MNSKIIRAKSMGVIMRNSNEILVHLGEDPVKGIKFGRLLGGSIEFGETSEQALHREFMEELGTKLENVEFLRVSENIFEYRGEPGHEIIFLYKADLANKELYKKDRMKMLDSDTEIAWLSLDEVKAGKIELFPLPARKEL